MEINHVLTYSHYTHRRVIKKSLLGYVLERGIGMDSQAVIQAFYAAIDSGDMVKLDKCLTDDFTFTGPVAKPLGKKEFLTFETALVAGLPNLKLNAKNIKVQGSKATVTVQLTGTHTAALGSLRPGMSPIPATGKKVTLPEENVTITVRDDKVAALEVGQVPGGGVPGILAQIGAADTARNA
jgi:ketosteroid isomerase-like protein